MKFLIYLAVVCLGSLLVWPVELAPLGFWIWIRTTCGIVVLLIAGGILMNYAEEE